MFGFTHIARPGLLPFAPLYGLAVWVRNKLFDLRLLRSLTFNIPVISVGNITVGGTGKTPHVEYLVQLFREEFRLAVLSRGYKRKTSGFLLVSDKSRVSEVGDEPLQIKCKYPDVHVAVDRNRVNGIRVLQQQFRKLDLIVLDDAYQHRYVTPCLSVLLIDYTRPVFSDILLPAGNLREPAKNIRRADTIIVTKCPDQLSPQQRKLFETRMNTTPEQKVFFTRYAYGSLKPVFPKKHHEKDPVSFKMLQKQHNGVLLVTGIANPAPLRKFLHEMVDVTEELIFPDHHQFTQYDLKRITERFNAHGKKNSIVVITEKDAVKIRECQSVDKHLKKVLFYLPVEVKFLAKGEKPFIKFTEKYIRKAGKKKKHEIA